MARPKKGTKESALATERWHETVKKRHGGATKLMTEIGRKGGLAPKKRPNGFAAMTPEQRSEAGRKGGLISRRRKKSTK